jgi:hypothetical protein
MAMAITGAGITAIGGGVIVIGVGAAVTGAGAIGIGTVAIGATGNRAVFSADRRFGLSRAGIAIAIPVFVSPEDHRSKKNGRAGRSRAAIL